MLTGLSAIVAVLCAAASLRRLRWAIAPTALDPAILQRAFTVEAPWATLVKLRDETAARSDCAWEHDLFAAFAERDANLRTARVNEQLTELDGLADLWGRVPRVCASIATSAGFLFASIWLLEAVTPAVSTEAVMATLVPALNALAVGMAGTSFCAAVHVKARVARRQRMKATDRLVEALHALATRMDAREGCRLSS